MHIAVVNLLLFAHRHTHTHNHRLLWVHLFFYMIVRKVAA